MSEAQQDEVKVVLADGMHFEGFGVPLSDTVSVHLDAKEDFGGQGKGVRPQSMMLVALGGCTGMDVISILRKKRQVVSGLELTITASRAAEHPRVYTAINVHYKVTGQSVDAAAVDRAIELSLERYCPVAGMLKTVVPITSSATVLEG